MAQRQFRISLTDPSFPLLSEQHGRTTMGATREELYNKGNKPGLFYCHNVMPTERGYDSVGFTTAIPAILDMTNFSDVRVIYAEDRSRVYLGFTADGSQVYSLHIGDTAWSLVSGFSAAPALDPLADLTEGRVNGISYIAFRNQGVFTYDSFDRTLTSITLTSLVMADILGVVSSSGFLLAYTKSSLAWSSTLDPTDFSPSQVTGAGGGNVAQLGGDILFCTPSNLGVFLFTDTNTISATYTGNSQYPFKFSSVANSKGGISLNFVAYEANTDSQFIYGKGGLQSLNVQSAQTVLPEVTDFLAGKVYEDYDEVTGLFSTTDLTGTMQKQIKLIASRYLILSYGITTFTYALIYDVYLKRYGKIKIEHTDVFEYVGATGTQQEVAKESIAFVQADGSVQTLDFSTAEESSGVLMLGKMQLTKTSLTGLLSIEIENVEDPNELTVTDLAALDGKNQTEVPTTLAYTDGLLSIYNLRSTARNHTIKLVGRFNLVTALITYIQTGRR